MIKATAESMWITSQALYWALHMNHLTWTSSILQSQVSNLGFKEETQLAGDRSKIWEQNCLAWKSCSDSPKESILFFLEKWEYVSPSAVICYPELLWNGENAASCDAIELRPLGASAGWSQLPTPSPPPSSPFLAMISPCVNSIQGLLTAISGCALALGLWFDGRKPDTSGWWKQNLKHPLSPQSHGSPGPLLLGCLKI